MLSYGIFAMSFAAGLAFLVQERRLADGRTVDRFAWLPARETLDAVAFRAVIVGFPVFATMIVLGSWWASIAWSRYWGWDPKETSALVTWLVYAVYLHLRNQRGWRGRPAALVLVVGFVMVLVTYSGNLWFPGCTATAGSESAGRASDARSCAYAARTGRSTTCSDQVAHSTTTSCGFPLTRPCPARYSTGTALDRADRLRDAPEGPGTGSGAERVVEGRADRLEQSPAHGAGAGTGAASRRPGRGAGQHGSSRPRHGPGRPRGRQAREARRVARQAGRRGRPALPRGRPRPPTRSRRTPAARSPRRQRCAPGPRRPPRQPWTRSASRARARAASRSSAAGPAPASIPTTRSPGRSGPPPSATSRASSSSSRRTSRSRRPGASWPRTSSSASTSAATSTRPSERPASAS